MNESVNEWDVAPKELVKLRDGEYWLPVNSYGINFKISDIHLCNVWDDPNRVFGTCKQTLSIELEFDGLQQEEVWLAIYRVGHSNPLWADVIIMDDYDWYLDVDVEMESEPGLHFIMVNYADLDDTRGYEHIKEKASQLPYGVRYDFTVEPDGCSLIHPEIREIQFTPRPLSEWKKRMEKSELVGISMDVQLGFQKPFDVATNFLQMEIFDEALNRIAWSDDYASDEGYIKVWGVYPILDGEYQFVLLHNRTPIFCGEFVCRDGICTVERMAEWCNNKILADVLASLGHANCLKFNATTYGRRLQLLEDIIVGGDEDSCLESDYLDKLLAEQ